jgi:hypothetical protein
MSLELRYGDVVVGEISEPFLSDDTGYGRFHPRPVSAHDPLGRRVREFITFCEGWHARLKAGADPDASEFDAYREVWDSSSWHTVASDGSVNRIGGPVFVGGEVTWRPA